MAKNASNLIAAAVQRSPKGEKAKAETTTDIQGRPVRLSVDLDRDVYHELIAWCQGIAMKVGRTRVNHVWVLRALVDELFEDASLRQRVINRVREKHGTDSN